MPERVAFKVNIRCDAIVSGPEMARLIEGALGCSFKEGDNHGTPAWLGSFLGMRVVLEEWRGVGEAPIFRMFGGVLNDIFYRTRQAGDILSFMDISQGIIDVLDLSDAGEWRLPSDPEIDAELAWMKKVDPDE
jgi:hypothetical protein